MVLQEASPRHRGGAFSFLSKKPIADQISFLCFTPHVCIDVLMSALGRELTCPVSAKSGHLRNIKSNKETRQLDDDTRIYSLSCLNLRLYCPIREVRVNRYCGFHKIQRGSSACKIDWKNTILRHKVFNVYPNRHCEKPIGGNVASRRFNGQTQGISASLF